MIDKLLEKYGVKHEDLRSDEVETLNVWLQAIQKGQLSLESVREYISTMKGAVEDELTSTKHNANQDLFLKARLRNYLLLEAFLSTPERAKKQLENAMEGFASRVK